MKKIIIFFWALIFLQMINLCLGSELFVYTRPGCTHCEAAKKFLTEFEKRHPEVKIYIYDIWEDPAKMEELKKYAKEKGITQMGVPMFRSNGGFIVGFEEDPLFESKILSLVSGFSPPKIEKTLKVPFIGAITLSDYTPLFLAVILGLVDGFNPCAMWVLLILLSLLVHLKSRRRIFLIAGIFVLISGIIYFLFMSSILLFYDFIGFSRKLQLIIGIAALIIALVHIKDFFFFKAGISFSIPKKYQTRIAKKVSKIVQEQSLWIALLSAAGLAVFVNFVELLCTAGIPATFAEILAQNRITGPNRFWYLFIYTVFYMLDDGLMVFIATWTLTQTRLQEKAGRWLKLISGLVILTLSLMMIFFPETLNFGL